MKTYKAELTVPVEDFGNIKPISIEGTAQEIVDAYHEFRDLLKPRPQVGLSDKEMNLFIDTMLLGKNGNHIDTYNRMSKEQQYAVQTLKRGLKRLKARSDEEEPNLHAHDMKDQSEIN